MHNFKVNGQKRAQILCSKPEKREVPMCSHCHAIIVTLSQLYCSEASHHMVEILLSYCLRRHA